MSTVLTSGSVACTSATGTSDDAQSTAPGSPRLSFQDVNDHEQVDPMANIEAWMNEVEEVHFDPPPIPQSYIDQILTAPLVVKDLSTYLAREYPDREISNDESLHWDEAIIGQFPQNGHDDEEPEDSEIEYEDEEVDLEELPDPLAELMRMIEGRS
ncbi:hypothetical protein LA080_010054 [Diaporthe eres]|nr:hypothetical protein LA080_010054 [Diaporthe eres]